MATYDKRLALVEEKLTSMVPQLKMAELERRLDTRMAEMSAAITLASEKNSGDIQRLTATIERHVEDSSKNSKRLSEINEEMMVKNAQEKAEKHALELQAKQNEIDVMKARSWDVQLVRWGGIVTAAGAAGGGLWWLFTWLLHQVPK